MNANHLSTLILTIFLLPLTLQIRADAVQNRSDIAIDRQYGNKLFPTRLAQDDQSNPGLTPVEVQKAAQQITVRITSANSGGSGVLIAKKGSTYLVLTNRHVAGRDPQFQIQTPDGQKHTAKPVANTGFDPKYDIALLQFTSDKQYQLADLNNGSTLAEDRTIYSVGYPFDSNKTRISIGKVSQLSDVPLDDGTQIGYTIDNNSQQIKQGMSGGPIVDGRGVLLGINTIGSNPIIPSYAYFDGSKPDAKRAAKYQQANWGVPVYNFLTQLDANILYNYDNFPKVQRQVTPTGYMAKLNRETRQQTVRIETASAGSGSGVIVAKQGNTYYVLTAKHVVQNLRSKKFHADIKTITHDQEKYQIQPSNITLAEGLDLAIVKFTSQTNYPVAKLGNYSPNSGATVFAAGYPDRDRIDSPLWQWQLNPGGIEDKEQGKFATQDKQSFSNGYDIIYSSISYGGMSGGPVFDTEGRVIGIHGKAEGEKRGNTELILGNSLGISIQTFLGVSNRLQVPNLLQISTNLPRDLNPTDRSTVIAVRDNIAKPQDESNGEQWLQYGNQLYRIGKQAEAAIAFDKAIAKGSQYKLTGNYGKALALAEIDSSQALTAISTAISVVPLSERKVYYYLWKQQSVIFRELGKYDDALRSIDIAIQLEPNDLTLFIEKSGLFSKKKQYQDAIAIFDSLINIKPEAYAYYNRGIAKYELDQKQAAITDYDRAIAINPNFSQAYYNRGSTKSELDQKQAAITDYDRAIAINPNYSQAYYNRGIAKYELDQKQAAVTDYDRAIAINPNFSEAYYNRGSAKSDLRQNQAAITDYDRAIAINPNYSKAYYNRGNAKLALGQKQAAVTDYDRAIAINPNFSEAYTNRGIAKSDLEQKQAAITDFDRAIAINPNFSEAYLNRGIAKSALEQKQAAIADYDRAIAINPNYSEAYNNRAIDKSALGQKQAAITDYDRAIAINSNYALAYYNRGIVKSALGQKQAAITDFDRAIAINSNDSKAYYNRGLVKSALGQKQTAIIDLTKAAELFRQQNRMDLYQKTMELLQKIKE
jgi:tetratricopeptide (TPR) repeat protein/S1-C subfamily serine protease